MSASTRPAEAQPPTAKQPLNRTGRKLINIDFAGRHSMWNVTWPKCERGLLGIERVLIHFLVEKTIAGYLAIKRKKEY